MTTALNPELVYRVGPYRIRVRGDGYVDVYDRQGQCRWFGTEEEALGIAEPDQDQE